MKNFGKNVNIKPKKQKGLSEKEIFVDIISLLDDCFSRSASLEQAWVIQSFDQWMNLNENKA